MTYEAAAPVAAARDGNRETSQVFYSHGQPMEDTFEGQLVELRPRLVGFAFSLAREAAEAEDLAQEAISRALAAQERFQPDTNLRAWLFTILRNLHLNRLRSDARRPPMVDIDGSEVGGLADGAIVEESVVLRAEATRVMAALRNIPPTFAAPLHLVAVEELTYAEVAAILDIPIGTVMSRIYRARRLLIENLGS